MLPLIVLAAGGAAAFRAFKPRCNTCESQFTLNERCLVCSHNVCGDCGLDVLKSDHKGWPISQSGRVCRAHEDEYRKQVLRLRKAVDDSAEVKIFSKNYRGATPTPRIGKEIQTEEHTDRDDAERQLQILAAMENCDAVIDVRFERGSAQNGNYTYSTWQAIGTI